MILFLILLMVFSSTLVLSFAPNWIYLIPFCISPIILKAFFDNRIALFVHLITILILGFIMPNGFEFVFLQFIAGIISILTVLKMYKRAQLFTSVIKIMGAYLLVYVALSITHAASFNEIEFGAHLHVLPNNVQALSKAAFNGGCRRFDSVIRGFGGCPMAKDDLTWYMPTELLLSWLESQNIHHGIANEPFTDAIDFSIQVFKSNI